MPTETTPTPAAVELVEKIAEQCLDISEGFSFQGFDESKAASLIDAHTQAVVDAERLRKFINTELFYCRQQKDKGAIFMLEKIQREFLTPAPSNGEVK